MYTCYVALGDSMTEGYGDEVEGIIKKPWPNLLAEGLAISEIHNLGKSGLRSDQILEQQLEKALELKPDLASITAGGNDFMQRKWNPKAYEQRMMEMIKSLQREGATVITSTLPDFTIHLPLPFWKKVMIKYGLLQCNKIMNQLAKEYNTVHIDFWNHSLTREKVYWSKDFVHPNAKGYVAIAKLIQELLEKKTGLT